MKHSLYSQTFRIDLTAEQYNALYYYFKRMTDNAAAELIRISTLDLIEDNILALNDEQITYVGICKADSGLATIGVEVLATVEDTDALFDLIIAYLMNIVVNQATENLPETDVNDNL